VECNENDPISVMMSQCVVLEHIHTPSTEGIGISWSTESLEQATGRWVLRDQKVKEMHET